MTGDDKTSPDDVHRNTTSSEGPGAADDSPAKDSPKKAPISFGGATTSADGWNVVPSTPAVPSHPQAQPLKVPAAKKNDKAPLSPAPPAPPKPPEEPAKPVAEKPAAPSSVPDPEPAAKSQPEKPQPTKPQATKPAPAKPKAKPAEKKAPAEKQPTQAKEKPKPPASKAPKKSEPPKSADSDNVKPEESASPKPAAAKETESTQTAPKPPAEPGKRSHRLPDIPIVKKQPPPKPIVDTGEKPEEESEETVLVTQIAAVAIQQTPAWLVSMVIHLTVLILLLLITVVSYHQQPTTVEAVYAEDLGEQLEFEVLVLDTQEFEVDANSGALETLTNSQEIPLPRSLTNVELIGVEAAQLAEEDTPGVDLKARGEGATKKAMLKAYGGNATTEQAVANALDWLKRNQSTDGSWSLKGTYSDGSSIENRISATAMALLAFQGAGHTDRAGTHAKTVAKGWTYLFKQLDADGSFLQGGGIPNQHRPYTQAQATIALCELYAMTGDEELRPKAQAAINYALKWQAPEGGWRYTPGLESDLSVSGWFLMALKSAKMGNLDVPDKAFKNVDRFLDSVTSKPDVDQKFKPGSRYQYRDSRAEKPSPTMTAEGLLCRQYLGWKQDDPRLVEGMEYLLAHPVRWEEPNVYYWYYATQVAHHMEGDAWRNWNKDMRQIIPENQVDRGREKGSWDPAHDENGVKAGRLFQTCLCTYMLEVYYRHLPLYSKFKVGR